jgi:hypothetical protein
MLTGYQEPSLVIPDQVRHQNLVAVEQEEQLQAREITEQDLGLVAVERLHRLQPALPVGYRISRSHYCLRILIKDGKKKTKL